MQQGIYTLANDNVYDQLVALLNSIEANYSKEIPVCVIPYDDNIERLKDELKLRPNVTLFQDADSIAKWEKFATDAWSLMPGVLNLKPKTSNLEPKIWGRHKLNVHRKLCCFDGPFDRFVFMDADTLVMRPLDFVFDELSRSDFVVYDYQYKDASHVFNMTLPRLYEVFPKDRIDKEIFCTGFFASRKSLFDDTQRALVLSGLKEDDGKILYPKSAEQSLMNYIIMKTAVKIHNFALSLPSEERTGNAVTSTHFEAKDNVLYDKGKRLAYLHYIGITAAPFRKLCAGENIDFPYRDIFLHYRYLHEPQKRPVFRGKAKPYNQAPGLVQRILRKLVA